MTDHFLCTSSIRILLLLISISLCFTDCKKGRVGKVLDKDTYKSPYLPAGSPLERPPTDKKEEKEEASEPVSRFHPASEEREYPMYSIEAIAECRAEKGVLELLSDPRQGVKALSRVRKLGPSGVSFLRRCLRHPVSVVRKQACLVIGNLKNRSSMTVDSLSDAVLLDPDPNVRAFAAKTFIAVRSVRATPALIRSLMEDPYAPARANAARALGSIGGNGAVNALLSALDDDDTWVRLRSVSALKKRRAKSAIPRLIEMLEDSNRMVRTRALDVLKSLTGKDKGSSPSDWR